VSKTCVVIKINLYQLKNIFYWNINKSVYQIHILKSTTSVLLKKNTSNKYIDGWLNRSICKAKDESKMET